MIGLAPAHLAFKDEGGITAVDFNVGKSDRRELKVSGKRKKVSSAFPFFFPSFYKTHLRVLLCVEQRLIILKKIFEDIELLSGTEKDGLVNVKNIVMQNAQHFETNTALCKVSTTNDASYVVRCKTFFPIIVFSVSQS